MESVKLPRMNGGIGDTSYAKNSVLQRKVILMTKPIMDKAISGLYHNMFPIETINFADLGCSSGPNTFLVASQFVKAINDKCNNSDQQQSPEYHIFLNDLPGNDFNTVFRSLLPEYQEDLRKHGINCFVTGVPGSFYDRLFPSKSLHFVHSSYSLHWLSQVPNGIENDKENIYIASTSPPNVAKAYYGQFEEDFFNFLKCRSKELMKGGRMVLTQAGRKTEDPASKECSYIWELLVNVFNELVAEGSMEKEKVDSFNVPIYFPSPTEIIKVVEKEGSFTIDCLETSESHWDTSMGQCMRAVIEPLLVSHFGYELMDKIFNKYTMAIVDGISKEKAMFVNVITSLTKKY